MSQSQLLMNSFRKRKQKLLESKSLNKCSKKKKNQNFSIRVTSSKPTTSLKLLKNHFINVLCKPMKNADKKSGGCPWL